MSNPEGPQAQVSAVAHQPARMVTDLPRVVETPGSPAARGLQRSIAMTPVSMMRTPARKLADRPHRARVVGAVQGQHPTKIT